MRRFQLIVLWYVCSIKFCVEGNGMSARQMQGMIQQRDKRCCPQKLGEVDAHKREKESQEMRSHRKKDDRSREEG